MSNYVLSITKFRRPSTEVSWWGDFYSNDSEQWNAYIKETYFDAGKALERTMVLSEDQLHLTVTTVWTSNELRNAYTKDPIVRKINLTNKKHYDEVGIEATWENIEYVENTENELKRWSGTFNDGRHLDELSS